MSDLLIHEKEGDIIITSKERTRCEIWSRVMGYHRPVSEWNLGKKQEFNGRKYYEVNYGI